MKSHGGPSARFYGLAKVHKANNPLRLVLKLPGSSHYNLNKVLAKIVEKIECANIETNSLEAREISKSLYTNVPRKKQKT